MKFSNWFLCLIILLLQIYGWILLTHNNYHYWSPQDLENISSYQNIVNIVREFTDCYIYFRVFIKIIYFFRTTLVDYYYFLLLGPYVIYMLNEMDILEDWAAIRKVWDYFDLFYLTKDFFDIFIIYLIYIIYNINNIIYIFF